MRRYIEYFPPLEKENKTLQQIGITVDEELINVGSSLNLIFENQFILTADEDTISKYEKMFGLEVSEEESIEDRKLKILTFYQNSVPYTYRSILSKVYSIIGPEHISFSLPIDGEEPSFILDVTLSGVNRNIVLKVLDPLLPCNIVIRWKIIRQLKDNKIKLYTAAQRTIIKEI